MSLKKKKTGIDKVDVTSFYDFFCFVFANLHVSTTIWLNVLETCIDVDCFATFCNCFWISLALYFPGLNKLQISKSYKLQVLFVQKLNSIFDVLFNRIL